MREYTLYTLANTCQNNPVIEGSLFRVSRSTRVATRGPAAKFISTNKCTSSAL